MLRAASRATFVFGLLAFGTQAVLSFTSVSFSNVQQCNAFNIKFSGGQLPDALPLTLTILPFDAEPIQIPLPINSWNVNTSVGAAVTFIPLPAGTTFLASLDDADGNGLGQVSDVMKIQSSSNDSCLPGSSTASRFVSIDKSVTQCQEFNVTYDTDIVTSPPLKLRAFTPRFKDFSVPIADDDDDDDDDTSQAGLSRYIMDGFHGFQVVMLYNDSAGHLWTSNLTTIGGDSTSSFKCFPKSDRSTNGNGSNDKGNGNNTNTLSNTTKSIIGAICGTVVGVVLLVFAILLRRKLLNTRVAQIEDAKGSRSNSMADSGNSVILSTDIFLSGPASMEVFKQLNILEGKMPNEPIPQVPQAPPNRNRASSFGFNTTMRMDRDVPSSPFSAATFFRDATSMRLPRDSNSNSISVSSPRLPTIAGDHMDPLGTARSGGNSSFNMYRNGDIAAPNTQTSPRAANTGLRSSYGSGTTASTDGGFPRRPDQAAKKPRTYRSPGSF